MTSMARKSGNASSPEERRDSRASPRRAAPQGPSQRQLRVAEEVRHALSAVFMREEFRDPDLAGLHVTVTEVRASPDLKHMTAFVSGLGKDLTAAQFAGLRRVSPFLRTQVSRAVRLKFAPDIHFQPDTALDYAMHISKVMQRPEVQQDLAPKPATTPDESQDDDAS
jgi:ribosome-binding factor A